MKWHEPECLKMMELRLIQDWGTAGTTVFQYNYSHDNEGGFWLDCMKLNHNRDCEKTILRYNISMRDGRGIAVYDQGILTEWYGNLFSMKSQSRFVVLMKVKISILTLMFSASTRDGLAESML